MVTRHLPALCLPAVALLSSVLASAGATRSNYDPKSLGRESMEVDLVQDCSNQMTCSVTVPGGVGAVHVGGTAKAKFVGLNAPDGVIGDQGDKDAFLPANSCVDAGSYTIDSFYWKAANTQEKVAPGGYDPTTGNFTRTVSWQSEWSIYSFDPKQPKPSHFCIQGGNAQFAVLWVKLTPVDTTKVDSPESQSAMFSETMKRASVSLRASLAQAYGEAQSLADRDGLEALFCTDQNNDCTPAQNAQVDGVISHLLPLIQTLDEAQTELDPVKNGTHAMVSVASPKVRDVIKSVESAYAYAAPAIEPLATKVPKIRKKDKKNATSINMLVGTVSFQQNLAWLKEDIESYQLYGETVEAKSSIDLLSQILIQRLAAMHRPETTAALKNHADEFTGVVDHLQTLSLSLQQAASTQGENSPETRQAAQTLLGAWKSDGVRHVVEHAVRTEAVHNDLELFANSLDSISKILGLSAKSTEQAQN